MTDVLLFDLGGVLVDYTGVEGLQPLLRTPLDQSTIRRRLLASTLVRQFETGMLSPAAFADAFTAEWDLTVPPATFLAEFRGWSRGLLPGAREVVSRLAVAPERVMFFDDLEANVAAANAEGLRAFQVRGIEQLTRCLRDEGLLPGH